MFKWNPKVEVTSAMIPQHPVIRPTSYMEVHALLGTSGCSNDGRGWDWSVMGVIDNPRGKVVVSPGDWIREIAPGVYYPTTHVQDVGGDVLEVALKAFTAVSTGDEVEIEQTTPVPDYCASLKESAIALGHTSPRPRYVDDDLIAILQDTVTQVQMLSAQYEYVIPQARLDAFIKQLVLFHTPEEWDVEDEPLQLATYKALLEWLVMHSSDASRYPGLGMSFSGNLLAAWICGTERLCLEFFTNGTVEWVVSLDGTVEKNRVGGLCRVEELFSTLEHHKCTYFINT